MENNPKNIVLICDRIAELRHKIAHLTGLQNESPTGGSIIEFKFLEAWRKELGLLRSLLAD